MTYIQALILGIVQGFSEFLPISSSGHLVLIQHLFGLKEDMLQFDIFLHFGTLIAVFVVFRQAILSMIVGSLRDIDDCRRGTMSLIDCLKGSRDLRLAAAIIIGSVPAAVIGLTFNDAIEDLFSSVVPVLFALALTAVILLTTFVARKGNHQIGPLNGFFVGLAQAVAIVPGISRSGSTISAALFLGVERKEAGEFSFLLSIPAIGGATLLASKDVAEAGFGTIPWGPCLTGMATAIISGWFSLVLLMTIVRRGKLGWFGFYCLAVVLAGVILYRTGAFSGSISQQSSSERTVTAELATIPSSFDGAEQRVRYYKASGESRPLVVALHTWSYSADQEDVYNEYFKRCADRGWHCIFPDFRGPNNKPLACGSQAAMRDILDAVEWAQDTLSVDPRRIFLVGASGGGHMTLQMAGNFPTVWTAASAWVPIAELARWHAETTERGMTYAATIEASCGGAPGISREVDYEYTKRSPLFTLWRAHIVPMDINAGIHDGHGGELGGEGSVPVGHSIRAFNELAKAAGHRKDMISEEAIVAIEHEEAVPDSLTPGSTEDEPLYGRKIYLRRQSGLARLTLFEGGHDIVYDAAFAFFATF